MIRVSDLRIEYRKDIKELEKKIANKLSISKKDVKKIEIVKKSIDARKKPDIYFVYTVDIELHNENKLIKKNPKLLSPKRIDIIIPKVGFDDKPVVIGSGPSGLFCALILARAGVNPIIIEQGSDVDTRNKKIKNFFEKGELDELCNVQFGEGGAGTFSDGKLNTSVKDNTNKFILKEFVKAGADEEILYSNKPHLGTDVLVKILKNIRNEIESLGGKFIFNTVFTDFVKIDNKVKVYTTNGNFDTNHLILALGNSSRNTFKKLKYKGINIVPKPFAVGYRVQHPQSMINKAMYGREKDDILGAADYKLTYTSKKGIPVYSFCMCPGGYVVNSSSDIGYTVINGMSYSGRNSKNANSAIIVGVRFDTIEEAIDFQYSIEKKAYECVDGRIPTSLYSDFKNNNTSKKFGDVQPQFKGKYALTNLRGILPRFIEEVFIEGMENFSSKIKDFNREDVIVSAVESRTSSPIRIVRDKLYRTNVENIYPIGEGAGYAGGIMSAAIDGVKVALTILEKR